MCRVYIVFQSQQEYPPLSNIYHFENRQIIIISKYEALWPIQINDFQTIYTRFERFNSFQLINTIVHVEWIERFGFIVALQIEKKQKFQTRIIGILIVERRMINV